MTESTPSPLARLIAQWREKARINKLTPTWHPNIAEDLKHMSEGQAFAREECADELEAALRDSESAPQGTKENDDLTRVEPPARLRR